MRRIKLAIVATCTAVAAATITPAHAADVEPNTLAALSEEVKENGVLPVALSISLSVEPGMI